MTFFAGAQIAVFFACLLALTKPLGSYMAHVFSGQATLAQRGQSYAPELTVSYSSNMVALAIHNWCSGAVGIAIAMAVIRGFASKNAAGVGNFWADVVRATVYVLLPIALFGALVFVALGVIKHLGTNGGGFFNANSAHPFENPTPLSNGFTLLLIWCIPAALTHTFGKLVGNTRQGWAIFGAMAMLALVGIVACEFPKTGALAALNTWPGAAYGGSDSALGPATGNLNNAGPHGFSEIFYAYASATGNNGSAFAGLTANTPWYNTTLGLAMLIGRFMMIVPLLAMAGALAKKPIVAASAGMFPTDTTLFAGLLVGVVIIVGALTYFPGLALGPIVEHFKLLALATH